MGLMTTPLIQLQLLQRTGTEQQQKYATRLIPLVKRHHLLLVRPASSISVIACLASPHSRHLKVTLLLAWTACNQTFPMFLQNLLGDPYITLGVSIPVVLFFVQYVPNAPLRLSLAEVVAGVESGTSPYPSPRMIPQATFQRYALQVGWGMSWFAPSAPLYLLCIAKRCRCRPATNSLVVGSFTARPRASPSFLLNFFALRSPSRQVCLDADWHFLCDRLADLQDP